MRLSPLDRREPATRAPLWLRWIILGVALWLAVKIVGNVTDSLTGMVHPPAPISGSARGV